MSMPFIPPVAGQGFNLNPDDSESDLPVNNDKLDDGETLDSRETVEQDIAEANASSDRLEK